jgi:hypothetical protein
VKGVEPGQKPPNPEENQQIPTAGAAKASVTICPPVPADSDLQTIIEAWAESPADVRKMIVGVVKLTSKAAQ